MERASFGFRDSFIDVVSENLVTMVKIATLLVVVSSVVAPLVHSASVVVQPLFGSIYDDDCMEECMEAEGFLGLLGCPILCALEGDSESEESEEETTTSAGSTESGATQTSPAGATGTTAGATGTTAGATVTTAGATGTTAGATGTTAGSSSPGQTTGPGSSQGSTEGATTAAEGATTAGTTAATTAVAP